MLKNIKISCSKRFEHAEKQAYIISLTKVKICQMQSKEATKRHSFYNDAANKRYNKHLDIKTQK